MSFQTQYELAQNETLRMKVKMATIKAANAVLADPQREAEWPFSYLVIREPNSQYWLDQIMYSVVSNPAINETSPDNDVEFTVNSVYGKHALANQNV